ncbi:MAG: hypothetical protein WED07_02720 [Candidatus Freyarchaeum deiterrae]
MVLHNIYIINDDGICPLSLKLGSIEADPDLVAGIFSATQTFWKEVTGEAPQTISFQDMNAYIKSFSIKKKGWYLLLITDAEKPGLVEKAQDSILRVIKDNRSLFEIFDADPSDINGTVGDSIISELSQIPCPHLSKELQELSCEIDGEQAGNFDCNLVSMAKCKTKIRDYQKKNLLQ